MFPDVDEIEEGDYTSSDGITWYQFGRKVFEINPSVQNAEEVIRDHANKERYWPAAWIISDHGNAHLVEY